MKWKALGLVCALLCAHQTARPDGGLFPSRTARPDDGLFRSRTAKMLRERALINEPESSGAAAPGAPAPSAPHVVLLERKTVGAYDVSVLSASDSGALKRWLDHNGYALPDAAQRPLAGYIKEKWTFVACRIKLPEKVSGLQQGVLAPLSLTFSTPQPVYPMRLSAINPRPFTLLLYLILPESSSSARLISWPGSSPTYGDRSSVSVVTGDHSSASADITNGPYPTLARLYQGEVRVMWKKAMLRPQDCTRDYIWSISHDTTSSFGSIWRQATGEQSVNTSSPTILIAVTLVLIAVAVGVFMLRRR